MNYLFTYFKQPEKKILEKAKTCLMLLALFFFGNLVFAQTPFITEWKTYNAGNSANNQIKFDTSGSYSYTVKRVGQATSTSGTVSTSGTQTITLPTPGDYELELLPTGTTPLTRFNVYYDGDAEKLVKIKQWGTTKWTNFDKSFMLTTNLSVTATDKPDLSQATSLYEMFYKSGVTNIPNINNGDVSKIRDMESIFGFSRFNADISPWDVSKVENMSYMFLNNVHFNQDISKWNTSKVQEMPMMFYGATSFSQNLGSWNLSKVSDASQMFSSGMSCQNYSSTLAGWAANYANSSTSIDFRNQGGPKYSPEVIAARNHLINNRNWQISGDVESTTACPVYFITEWQTNGGTEIIIPAFGNYTYSWVDLNDATRKGNGYGANITTVDFGQEGNYEVRLLPFDQSPFSLNFGTSTSTNKKKLTKITQWGATTWSTFNRAFEGTSNLNITATDRPDLDQVQSMYSAFKLSGISAVPLMANWNFRNVVNTNSMFETASNFNQDLSYLNVSNVTSMEFMFAEAEKFNQDISMWNVSNVTSMYAMFYRASDFNQDISSWVTSKVKNMDYLFRGATAFDQNLGTWNLSSLESASDMLNQSGLGCINYSKTLQGWANNPSTPSSIILGAAGRIYSSETVSDRNQLINNKNWTITGDSQGTCSLGALNADLSNFKLFPNPVTDFLTVNGLEGKETLSLYDMSGRLMQSSKTNGKEVKLNLSLYAKGIYLLNITSDKGTTTKKIIKQ